MRFHVVSLPHTQTTDQFPACAFTEKVRNFCVMMMSLGHEVYLYSGALNTTPCTEHIPCLTEADQIAACEGRHYTQARFDPQLPGWVTLNTNAIAGIAVRKREHDFICLVTGWIAKPIANAFPRLMTVEFGIGYAGSFAKYRVWESYAWMHTCYGVAVDEASKIDGIWFDEVIPGYFDVSNFPFATREEREDYFFFIGRLINRKGWHIAEEVCKHLGKRLVIAGPGDDKPTYGEYVGTVTPQERNEWMRKAQAVFVPTTYIEPFGNVAVEAQACGTPVICTDWGAFTETVVQGITGFRCRSFQDFIDATSAVKNLEPLVIRAHAQCNYSLEVARLKYQRYFERLLTLWDKGWYQLRKENINAETVRSDPRQICQEDAPERGKNPRRKSLQRKASRQTGNGKTQERPVE